MKNSGMRLTPCHKVCCKSCRCRIIKVLRLIGGKTRARVLRTRTGGLSKSTASLADFILITRGVDFAFLSLCDRLQIMLNIERDKKLPSYPGEYISYLVDEKKIRIVSPEGIEKRGYFLALLAVNPD